MSDSVRFEIEHDGQHCRWVFMWGNRRLAKSSCWFNSEDEALADADYFASHAKDAPVRENP